MLEATDAAEEGAELEHMQLGVKTLSAHEATPTNDLEPDQQPDTNRSSHDDKDDQNPEIVSTAAEGVASQQDSTDLPEKNQHKPETRISDGIDVALKEEMYSSKAPETTTGDLLDFFGIPSNDTYQTNLSHNNPTEDLAHTSDEVEASVSDLTHAFDALKVVASQSVAQEADAPKIDILNLADMFFGSSSSTSPPACNAPTEEFDSTLGGKDSDAEEPAITRGASRDGSTHTRKQEQEKPIQCEAPSQEDLTELECDAPKEEAVEIAVVDSLFPGTRSSDDSGSIDASQPALVTMTTPGETSDKVESAEFHSSSESADTGDVIVDEGTRVVSGANSDREASRMLVEKNEVSVTKTVDQTPENYPDQTSSEGNEIQLDTTGSTHASDQLFTNQQPVIGVKASGHCPVSLRNFDSLVLEAPETMNGELISPSVGLSKTGNEPTNNRGNGEVTESDEVDGTDQSTNHMESTDAGIHADGAERGEPSTKISGNTRTETVDEEAENATEHTDCALEHSENFATVASAEDDDRVSSPTPVHDNVAEEHRAAPESLHDSSAMMRVEAWQPFETSETTVQTESSEPPERNETSAMQDALKPCVADADPNLYHETASEETTQSQEVVTYSSVRARRSCENISHKYKILLG